MTPSTTFTLLQQQSGLVARDVAELEPLLVEQTAPAIFWLADGHANLLDTDVDDRFGLTELARIRNRSTVALLMLNPQAAVGLTMVDAGAGTASAALPASAALSIVVAVGEGAAFSAAITGPDGATLQVKRSADGFPVVLDSSRAPAGSSLTVMADAGTSEARAWLIAQ